MATKQRCWYFIDSLKLSGCSKSVSNASLKSHRRVKLRSSDGVGERARGRVRGEGGESLSHNAEIPCSYVATHNFSIGFRHGE